MGHFQNLQGKFKQQIEQEMEQLQMEQLEQQEMFQFGGGMATDSDFLEGEDLEQPPQIFHK